MTHTCCACTGCACHAHHGEEKTFWAAYRGLAAAAVLFIAALFMGKWPWVQLAFCVISWGIAGREVVFHALRGLVKGDFLDENFLMTLATVGAFCLGEYPEAAAVMLFYQIGEAFQPLAIPAALSGLCWRCVRPLRGCGAGKLGKKWRRKM